jgi:uncharacterized protein (DUF58 family)
VSDALPVAVAAVVIVFLLLISCAIVAALFFLPGDGRSLQVEIQVEAGLEGAVRAEPEARVLAPGMGLVAIQVEALQEM